MYYKTFKILISLSLLLLVYYILIFNIINKNKNDNIICYHNNIHKYLINNLNKFYNYSNIISNKNNTHLDNIKYKKIICLNFNNIIINLYLIFIPLSIIFLSCTILYIRYKKKIAIHYYTSYTYITFLILKNLLNIVSLLQLEISYNYVLHMIIEYIHLLSIYLCFSWFIVNCVVMHKILNNINKKYEYNSFIKYYLYGLLYALTIILFIAVIDDNYEIEYNKYINRGVANTSIIYKYVISCIFILILKYIYISIYYKLKYTKIINDNYNYVKLSYNFNILLFIIFISCRCIEIVAWYIQNNITKCLIFVDIFQGMIIFVIILLLLKKNKIKYYNNSTYSDMYINHCCFIFNIFYIIFYLVKFIISIPKKIFKKTIRHKSCCC